MAAERVGAEEQLIVSQQTKTLADWSPNGLFLLYMNNDSRTGQAASIVVTDQTPATGTPVALFLTKIWRRP